MPIQKNININYISIFFLAFPLSIFLLPGIAPLFFFSLILFVKASELNLKVSASILVFYVYYMASIYQRTNLTGDVVQYQIIFDSMNRYNSFQDLYADTYNLFYSGWNLIHFTFFKLNFRFDTVQGIICSLYFLIGFGYIISFKSIDIKTRRLFLIYFFFFFSLPFLLSSYRNQFALIIFAYAFHHLNAINGFGLKILSLSIHPSVIIIWIYQKFRVPRKFIDEKWMLCFMVISIFIKPIFVSISHYLSAIPFIGSKISVYVLGGWANYDLTRIDDILLILNMSFCVLSVMFSTKILKNELIEKERAVLSFFIYSLFFISFQTLAQRFIYFGFLMQFPFVMRAFDIASKKNRLILTLLLIMTIDFRTFLSFFIDGFYFGEGFPWFLVQGFFDE